MTNTNTITQAQLINGGFYSRTEWAAIKERNPNIVRELEAIQGRVILFDRLVSLETASDHIDSI